MLALLYKDFQMIKKQILLMIPMILFISLTAPMAISGIFLMLAFITVSITYGFDEQNGFLRYGMAMPLFVSDYLISKLVPSLLFGIIGGLVMYFIGQNNFGLSPSIALLAGVAVFSLTLLFSALVLPFLIRFGLERGRFIMMIFFFVIFGLFSFIGNVAKNPEGWVEESLRFPYLP